MVLGKSKMIAGWEERLPTMLKRETTMLKIQFDLHYANLDTITNNFRRVQIFSLRFELLHFEKVKVSWRLQPYFLAYLG
jgi:hypothetical protein